MSYELRVLDKVYLETITVTLKEMPSLVFCFQLTQHSRGLLKKLEVVIVWKLGEA